MLIESSSRLFHTGSAVTTGPLNSISGFVAKPTKIVIGRADEVNVPLERWLNANENKQNYLISFIHLSRQRAVQKCMLSLHSPADCPLNPKSRFLRVAIPQYLS